MNGYGHSGQWTASLRISFKASDSEEAEMIARRLLANGDFFLKNSIALQIAGPGYTSEQSVITVAFPTTPTK